MALVPDQKFSTFQNGGDLELGDIIVGLRNGLNTRFNYTGGLPPGVIIPIANGGTGADNAADARTNLGLGTMSTQNANAVAITGGTISGVSITGSTAALTSGSVTAVPIAGTDLVNKTYVDSIAGVSSVTGTTNQVTVDNTDPANPVISLPATLIAPGVINVGNLLFSNNDIMAVNTNGDINLNPNGTGAVVLYGQRFPNTLGTNGYFLQTDGAGNLSWAAVGGSGTVSAGTQNQIAWYAANGSTVSGLANNNSAVLTTSAGGVPLFRTTLPASLVIPTPRINQINDTNGNTSLAFQATTSAVNYFSMINAATGNNPQLLAFGTDTNVGFIFSTKGTGMFNLNSAHATQPLLINSGTGLQHATTFNFANTANTRDVTFPDATGTLLMTGVAINSVPSITFNSTSGIIGTTTNNNAAAGSVGEYVSAQRLASAGLNAASTTPTDITSISLTAGDWNVWGLVSGSGAVTTSIVSGWCSTTSATAPDLSLRSTIQVPGGGVYGVATPMLRVSVSGTTTVYLSGLVGFTGASSSLYGSINARRIR